MVYHTCDGISNIGGLIVITSGSKTELYLPPPDKVGAIKFSIDYISEAISISIL
jgi:hypothetical protein